MHRLLLLRHAKSSWDEPALPDPERPLAQRGRKAAKKMARHLRGTELRADLVLCSSSRRTRETLEILAPAFGGAELLVEDRLYGAGDDELLGRLREVPESAGTVALIGHNPGVQDLAVELAGPDPGSEAGRLRERFPTGAVAVFELDGDWRGLGPGRGRLVSFTVPRELA
jgi:phosphohistidine phosphatase